MRVAVLITAWFDASHADVIVPRLVNGWVLEGEQQSVELEVAAVYLEQLGSSEHREPCQLGPTGGADLGLDFLSRHGIPRAATIGEALGAGAPGVNVDGVVIVAEHGEYALNEYRQQTYPRRRFFDAAVAAMVSANRFVPIFNDKGLSYCARDANEMVGTARRLGIGLGAGSTVPISWRIPEGAAWPKDARMEEAVFVGPVPLERYGFHCLEGLQSQVERRLGGESGVRQVYALSASDAREAIRDGMVPAHLVDRTMDQLGTAGADRERAVASVAGIMDIRYIDGLRAFVVLCDEVHGYAVTCQGGGTEFSCRFSLQGHPYNHFGFLVRQIEHLVHTGHPQIPIERTQLATGVLDAAMRSWSSTRVVDTPDLAISYSAPTRVRGTGIEMPQPTG